MRSTAILSTPRLELRPFGVEHFEAFYASCICDTGVMGFFHSYRAAESDADRRARSHRDFVGHFQQGESSHGYICWALFAAAPLHANAGEFAGWCGILSPALDHSTWGPEIAYMVARPFQGLGLATEAGTAVLADAWSRYGLSRIHAVVDAPNLPSRRVLERLGMQLHGQVEVYGSKDMLLYTSSKPVQRV